MSSVVGRRPEIRGEKGERAIWKFHLFPPANASRIRAEPVSNVRSPVMRRDYLETKEGRTGKGNTDRSFLLGRLTWIHSRYVRLRITYERGVNNSGTEGSSRWSFYHNLWKKKKRKRRNRRRRNFGRRNYGISWNIVKRIGWGKKSFFQLFHVCSKVCSTATGSRFPV